MTRASLLLLVFSLALALPSSGQIFHSGWKYQLELHQEADGQITISYSIRIIESQLSGKDESSGRLPVMNSKNSLVVNNMLMSGENTNSGQNHQLTPDYFHYINKHMPPVITLPETPFRNRFPQSSLNQYYPLPDGN